MKFWLNKLVATGPTKSNAFLLFDSRSHLVFGPTDSGKSYAVVCIRYCLGSGSAPEDIGEVCQGYSRLAMQIVTTDAKRFTLFRDMFDINSQFVYEGHHANPPQEGLVPISEDINKWLGELTNASSFKIITKAGKLGALTSGDLRRLSIFDEIEILSRESLDGNNNLYRARNKSAISLVLSGIDDSSASLVVSTDERNNAKGKAEVLNEEIRNINENIPPNASLNDSRDAFNRVENELGNLNIFLQSHTAELAGYKKIEFELATKFSRVEHRITSLHEGLERFELLNSKYSSDLQRLETITVAVAVFDSFETTNCPLCHTDITHQHRSSRSEDAPILAQAAQAEMVKIRLLQKGLHSTIEDVVLSLLNESSDLADIRDEQEDNNKLINKLLQTLPSNTNGGLSSLTERKLELFVLIRDLEKLDRLKNQLNLLEGKTKRSKQTSTKNIAGSSTELCKRIQNLLADWGVPDVTNVYFDESIGDIFINQRKRISYGKGKRAIFLSAYVIALMEQALKLDNPHMGFVILDSPVLTYRDPKHSKEANEDDELLDIGVKGRFYSWLASRELNGQIIVFENEEPEEKIKIHLEHTEFLGNELSGGRAGFFPVRQKES